MDYYQVSTQTLSLANRAIGELESNGILVSTQTLSLANKRD